MTARKLIMLGEIAVGKTSLVRRLALGRFDADYKATVGVDLYKHVVNPESPDPTHLVIWDIEGDMGESILSHHYSAGASGALIVSDVTRPETHDTARGLASEFRTKFAGRPYAFVANKIDQDASAITRHLEALETPHAKLYRTSAADGTAVIEAFDGIAADIKRRAL